MITGSCPSPQYQTEWLHPLMSSVPLCLPCLGNHWSFHCLQCYCFLECHRVRTTQYLDFLQVFSYGDCFSSIEHVFPPSMCICSLGNHCYPQIQFLWGPDEPQFIYLAIDWRVYAFAHKFKVLWTILSFRQLWCGHKFSSWGKMTRRVVIGLYDEDGLGLIRT